MTSTTRLIALGALAALTIAAPASAQDEPWSPEQTRAFLTTSGVCFAFGLPLTSWNNENDNAYDEAALDSMTSSSQLTLSLSGLDSEDRSRLRAALERPTLVLRDATLGAGGALEDLLAAVRVPPRHRRAWRARLRAERAALGDALGVQGPEARVDAVFAVFVRLSGT